MKIDKVLLFGIGFVAGILLAPKKGSETINDVKETVLEKTEYIKGKIDMAKSNFDSGIDEIEDSFYTKADRAKNDFVELKNEIRENVEEAIEEVDEK